MYNVTIGNETFFASDGETLSDVLLRAGKTVVHPCAGRGVCRKCTVNVNGSEALSCQYRIHSDAEVILPEQGEIESVTGGETLAVQTENVCFALDIGTTTLALALVATDEERIVNVITRTNPQVSFGADVISRIDHCRKNTAEPLCKAVIGAVNEMVSAFALSEPKDLFVAGNATMLHLFFNVDCSSIGAAPYTPVFLESKTETGVNMGLHGVRNVISLPNISSFVGADLVAGLNYVRMPADGKYSLLVDLGTNAEVVLFSKTDIFCTAAAAGPCFEGANIAQGMPATDGAITSFSLDGGVPTVKTVGNVSAVGICGTGLIDMIAELLRHGHIDETGFMEEESYEVAPGVFLEQGDVRQFQLAKSAVYSAVMSLLKIKNICPADVEKLYIAGGFSAKINVPNAVSCGLLPEELESRCEVLHNSSLHGTVRFACEQNDLSAFTKKARYVDLANNADFSQMFIENMMFAEV